jgi:hypothetical protein
MMILVEFLQWSSQQGHQNRLRALCSKQAVREAAVAQDRAPACVDFGIKPARQQTNDRSNTIRA